MREFTPRLDILPAQQRALWPELAATPPEFTLYGGTAIALQLGHRQSVDFDFLGTKDFDPDTLERSIPYLVGGETTQRAQNTLTRRVDRGGSVSLSFFHAPVIKPLAPPLIARDVGLKVAALIDLAGIKAELVQRRAQAKDFLDIDALLQSGLSLIEAMAAAKIIYGDDYRAEITLKALSYFGDGDLPTLSAAVRKRLQKAMTESDLHDLPAAHSKLLKQYRGHA